MYSRMMFNRKKYFSKRLLFNKASIVEIINQLKKAGYHDIIFKIPQEYVKFDKFEFSEQEFVDFNYNFVALIMIAKNTNETLKILFVNNSSSKTNFLDLTFPSSNSEHTKFYIETNDPARIIGLIDFLDFLLKTNSLRGPYLSFFQSGLFLSASLFVLVTVSSFTVIFDHDTSLLTSFFYKNSLLLSFITLLSLIYIFYYTITPGGLYINKFEHPFISFSKRIFIGDLKDNLIISFFLFISKLLLGGFLVNILWSFFGQTVIEALKFLYSASS